MKLIRSRFFGVGPCIAAFLVATVAGATEGPPPRPGRPALASPSAEVVAGEFVVKFKDAADAEEVAARGTVSTARRAGLASLLGQAHAGRGTRLFPRARSRRLDRVVKLVTRRLVDPVEMTAFLAELRRRPEIEYAEPNVVLRVLWLPDDPYYDSTGSWAQDFPDLWGLHRIATGLAWERSRGAGVVVGVLDTGIDPSHPDLAPNIWQNPGESGLDGLGRDKATNSLDDDGNGYVDDWAGWDFTGGATPKGDNDPMDDHGHGTHVAGTIAAVAGNGLGIAGVAPQARVMAIKVLNQYGSGYSDKISQGIVYAADNGAMVMNASLGGFGATPQVLVDALAYAHDVKGAIFVAAAGNSFRDVGAASYGQYPANIRDVVAVAATAHDDTRAYFSNVGVKIDVAAPGGGDSDSTGTVVQPVCSILSLLSSQAGSSMTGSGQLVVGGQYVRQAGTSMAAPHVAGVAALVRSLRPELSPEQVRQALRRGADDVGAPGFDASSGYGRLNADRALDVSAPLAVQITDAGGTFSSLQTPTFHGTAAGPGFTGWVLEYGSGSAPSSFSSIASSSAPVVEGTLAAWDLSGVADGSYTVRLVATGSSDFFEDRVAVIVDSVSITSPTPGTAPSVHRGGEPIEVFGTITPAFLQSYSFRIVGAKSSELANPRVTLAGDGTAPVVDGLLGTWDTTGAPADHYQVCVRVRTTDGATIEECTPVLVDPQLRPGWPQRVRNVWQTVHDHLTAVDVNGDGRQALLVSFGSDVRLYDADGFLLPGWPQPVQGYVTRAAAAGDLTGDGLPEIVAGDSLGNVFAWRGNGLSLPGWPKPLLSGVSTITIADVSGDGVNEIIAAEADVFAPDGSIVVVDKNGSALPGWPRSLTDGHAGSVSVGDVDGNGSNEIVVSSGRAPTWLYVLRGNGTLLPGWPKTVNSSLTPEEVLYSYPALADLDGDGALDIVIGSAGGQAYAFRGDGTLLPGWPRSTGVALNSPAVGDIDGDGRPEVVMGGAEQGVWDRIYAWNGNGQALAGWPRDFTPVRSFFGYGAPVLADLDGDGKSDVIVSSDADDMQAFALQAYRGDGTEVPGFPRPTRHLGAFPTDSAALADLDGDGLLEMAWIDANYDLFVWDLDAPATATSPWPMFHRDARHTGALPAPTRRLTVTITGTEGGRGSVQVAPGGGVCDNLTAPTPKTCTFDYPSGSTATLTAAAASGHAFVGWDGACSGNGVCPLTMSANRAVTAAFLGTNMRPVANPGGPYPGGRSQPVSFDGSASYDPEGAPLTYSWSFGDAKTGTGAKPSHAYSSVGTFVVSLTVSDGLATSAPAITTAVITDPPPAAVRNLAIAAVNNRSVSLTWTGTGEDGTVGAPAQYDVRFSTAPIDEASFANAQQVQSEPRPLGSGATESLTVPFLLPQTTYYFALTAWDAAGNVSGLSNVAVATTAPGVALFRDDFEGDVSGWTTAGSDGRGGPGLWHRASHRFSSAFNAFYYGIDSSKTYDTGARNFGSLTSGPIRLVTAKKPILSFRHFLSKEGSISIDRARLYLSKDAGATWILLNNYAGNLTMAAAEWNLSAFNLHTVQVRFDFDTVDGTNNLFEGWFVDDVMVTAEALVTVANPGGPYSAFKSQPVLFDGSGSVDPEGDPLTYSWTLGDGATATGVNPTHIYVARGNYKVTLVVSDGTTSSDPASTTVTVTNRRPVANPGGPYSGAKDQAIAFSGTASSDPDGDPLTYSWSFGDGATGTDPTPSHAYAAGGVFTAWLTVHDGTSSSTAVSTTVTIPDEVPPAPVNDLSAASEARFVKLSWTATGDDGATGKAWQYDLRYAATPITEASFPAATQVANEPFPGSAGAAESIPVSGLMPDTTYYFALEVSDPAGNKSALSNVAWVTTGPYVPLFHEDFEAGGAGWTTSGLWHVTNHRWWSPSRAVYYGLDSTKTYNTGARNMGALLSPSVDLAWTVKPRLTFWYFLKKEASPARDQARAYVSSNGGATWSYIGQFSAVNQMTLASFDLSAWVGYSVRLKFEFDTVDASFNNYEGWVIDEVTVNEVP